ncbi:MAG: hypothetical protein ACXVCP_08550 [Bdellovibrio sp.]
MIFPCQIEPPAYYYNMVQPYRDRFGLITQKDEFMDGGDSAHRTAIFYYGLYLQFENNKVELTKIKKRFFEDLKKLRVGPGRFVRHPDGEKWYSNPNNFSRDQNTPMVIALGAFGETAEITANLAEVINSYSFYPNKLKNWTNEEKNFPYDFRDLAPPSDWGMYIRALHEKDYHHLLYLTDLQLLADALNRIFISYYNPQDTSDDINFTLLLLQADRVMPTFFSKISKWLYTRFRKPIPLKGLPNNINGVETAWAYYFEYDKVRPPLNKVYQCALKNF